MRRPWRLLAALVLAATTVAGAASPAAADSGSDEARFLTLTNQLRASVGAPPLVADAALHTVAATWAVVMATAGVISHNPSLGVDVTVKWVRLGENVGVGSSVDIIQKAFVNSPHHYANIVDPGYTNVGIAVAYSLGQTFVVEDFLQLSSNVPSGSSAPTSASSAPTTKSRPAPPPPSSVSVAPRITTTTVTKAPTSAPSAVAVAGGYPARLATSLDELRLWNRRWAG